MTTESALDRSSSNDPTDQMNTGSDGSVSQLLGPTRRPTAASSFPNVSPARRVSFTGQQPRGRTIVLPPGGCAV